MAQKKKLGPPKMIHNAFVCNMEKPSFMYRWHIGVLVEVLYVYTYYI